MRTFFRCCSYVFTLFIFLNSSAFAVLQNHTPLTLNMQGSSASTDSKWTSTIQGFVRGHDVVALQEAGPETSLPAAAVLLQQHVVPNQPYVINEYRWRIGTQTRYTDYYLYFMQTDFGANRVNLAMVTQQRAVGLHFIAPQAAANNPNTTGRPAFGVRLPDNTTFYNTHALSMGRSTNPRNDANNIITAIRNNPLTPEWAVMGDFNQDPALVNGALNGQVVFRPYAATQMSGGELDYMVANIVGNIIPWLGNRIGVGSDHVAVEFRLGGAAGRVPNMQRDESDPFDKTSAPKVAFFVKYDGYPYCSYSNSTTPWQDPPNPPAGASAVAWANSTLVNDSTGAPLLITQGFDGDVMQSNISDDCVWDTHELIEYPPSVTKPIFESITSILDFDGNLTVVAAEINGYLDYTYQNETGDFSDWLGPPVTQDDHWEDPLLMRGLDGRLYLYASKLDGGIWRQKTNANGSWSGTWTKTTDGPDQAIKMTSAKAFNKLHVWALDKNGELYHKEQRSDNKWYAWTANFKNAVPLQDINAITDDEGDIYLFGIDFDGRVRFTYKTTSSGAWKPWVVMADFGVSYGMDSALTYNDQIELLVATTDGSLHYLSELSRGSFAVESFCSGRCLRTDHFPSTENPGTKLETTVNHQLTNQVQVTLLDGDGAPVEEVEIKFHVISGNGQLSVVRGKTDQNGKLKTNITKNNSTTATIEALYDSTKDGVPDTPVVIGNPQIVNFATGG